MIIMIIIIKRRNVTNLNNGSNNNVCTTMKADKASHVCDACGRGFKDTEALSQHVMSAHQGEQVTTIH